MANLALETTKVVVKTLDAGAAKAAELLAKESMPESLQKIATWLGGGAKAENRALELAQNGLKHERIAETLERNPQFVPFFKKQVELDLPTKILNDTERPYIMQPLTRTFPIDSSEFQHILQLDATDPRGIYKISELNKLGGGTDFIRRSIADGTIVGGFDITRSAGLATLEHHFGVGSPTVQRLYELESAGLKLGDVGKLVGRDPAKMGSLIADEVRNGADVSRMNFYTLNEHTGYNFGSLALALSPDVSATRNAAALARDGSLNVRLIQKFLGEQEVSRTSLLKRELATPNIGRNAMDTEYRLPGVELTERYLQADSEAARTARAMESSGQLSQWHLGTYLEGNPDVRVPLMVEALKTGSPETINGLIKSTPFSEETAARLVHATTNGDLSLAQVLAETRSMRTGAHFANLLEHQAQSGKPLTSRIVRDLGDSARHSPTKIDTFGENVNTELRMLKLPSSDRTMADTAKDLDLAVEILKQKFDPSETMVVLGRDMNAIVPLLRAHGRDARLFHWSRLQYGDTSTIRQWQSEVPKNSVVIDAGLAGSILDDIRKIDSTVKPYLLESGGRYPQLLPRDQAMLATDLEVLPKVTGRCRGYSVTGAALCQVRNNEDPQDYLRASMNAVRYNEGLLRNAGLSNWYVWRYRTLTGVSQAERIGQ